VVDWCFVVWLVIHPFLLLVCLFPAVGYLFLLVHPSAVGWVIVVCWFNGWLVLLVIG